MMMRKKGDLTIRYIVLFAMGLIVLIVVILIFKFGMDEFVSRLKEILKDIMAVKPEKLFEPTKK